MMRRSKWARRDETRFGRKQSSDGMDPRRFQAFFEAHRRKNRRNAFGEHRLAGTRAADEKHVMSTGHRDFDGALRVILASNVTKVFVSTVRFHVGGRLLVIA